MTSNTPRKRPNPRAEARRAAERRRRLLLIAGGVAVLILAVLIAVLSTTGNGGDEPTLDEVAAPVEVTGDPLTQHAPDAASDPAIGSDAPTVSGEDLAGEPVVVGGGEGPQLISFLASWCPACQQELPQLTSWLEDGGVPDGVDLVAVSTLLDPNAPEWPPQDWFEREGYPGTVLADDADSTTASAFGLSGTPFWVAVDGDGEVIWRGSGLLPTEELDALIDELAAS